MTRKMVVVPYDWAKKYLQQPEEEKRALSQNAMTRRLNLRFLDDQGFRRKGQVREESPPFVTAPQAPDEDNKDTSGERLSSHTHEDQRPPTASSVTQPISMSTLDEVPMPFSVSTSGGTQGSKTGAKAKRSSSRKSVSSTSRLVQFPEPYADIKTQLYQAKRINEKGQVRVISKKDNETATSPGSPIARSNVNEILDYLSGRRPGRAPTGTITLKAILEREKITLPQTGSGVRTRRWIRI